MRWKELDGTARVADGSDMVGDGRCVVVTRFGSSEWCAGLRCDGTGKVAADVAFGREEFKGARKYVGRA